MGDILHRRGISTVSDLLEFYPRAYEDRRAARSISSLEPDQLVSIKAQVLKLRSMTLGRSHRKLYEMLVGDETGRISCKFFRVPYKGYFERFEPHQKVRVMGRVTLYRGVKEFHHPDIHPLQEGEVEEDILLPIYTETEGLSPQKLRKMIEAALLALKEPKKESPKDWKGKKDLYQDPPSDPLPEWLKTKYQLPERLDALSQIHYPPHEESDLFLKYQSPSQRRIIFDEFFWLELHMAMKRVGIEREHSEPLQAKGEWVEKLKASLPFQLTAAQVRSFEEIKLDLAKTHPMHRLVQGDVGSGKTLVALMSAVLAAESGFQSTIMVPTEILAEQHFLGAQKIFTPLGLKVCLLTGSTKASEREKLLADLKSGVIHLCIGTHALIEDEVEFKKLGLVIIDEQHRFGVQQRSLLKAKGLSPHFLVMTATPIPRTLAMTVYGDLDVSVIDELPKGRQAIVTRKVFDNKRPKVMDFMKEQVQKGRQAYIVYPLVEESEKIDLKNAIEEFEKLSKQFPDIRFGLLHGRMKAQEKDAIMQSFRKGEIQVLVSTTVIEVGVDVPNANLMIIEHAERFGLSQLHQLRGRVGRGSHKSFCVLVLGYAVSEESKRRAEIMEMTSDGFKIAEADLEIRGPGEFLGRRQSGLPGFKLANLVRDVRTLQDARQAAFELIKKDPDLKNSEHKALKLEFEKARLTMTG